MNILAVGSLRGQARWLGLAMPSDRVDRDALIMFGSADPAAPLHLIRLDLHVELPTDSYTRWSIARPRFHIMIDALLLREVVRLELQAPVVGLALESR